MARPGDIGMQCLPILRVCKDRGILRRGQAREGKPCKTANCQTLVSATLARGEVPVTVGLRLFLSESWTSDPLRMAKVRPAASR
jgi:hypothetical protein